MIRSIILIRLMWRIRRARPVELEVLDQSWDGPVDQVAAVCQKVKV